MALGRAMMGTPDGGVIVRLILDPNKDAFGKQKNGIPNREIADTLVTSGGGSISVRWCSTHGEQCHAKMLIVKTVNNHSLILGSANFTRRNIGGYNLESDVAIHSAGTYPVWQQASRYFEDLWSNTRGTFSADYAAYQDTSTWKKVVAWIMENTGLGTF
jgi:phosphatidylserine/phosphatidylglycerophosphate/cardiolipin synthase-like enzyme